MVACAVHTPIGWLGVWFSERGSRSFRVFLVFHPETKHLRYNAMALFELLRVSLKIKNVSKPKFMESTPFYWWRYFNLNHKRYGSVDPESNAITSYKGRTAFAMSFTTNGVSCSIAMNRCGDGTSTKSKIPKKPKKKTTAVAASITRTIRIYIPDFWV